MARVFISHSSKDNEQAARIKSWLDEQGFDSSFLDFDKHAGIPPGANWERTLYSEIDQSEAVIVVHTSNWMDSKWCFAEFTQARALGKPIFPVIEAPTGERLIAADIQALDLTADKEGGLEMLARELTQIALDAQGGFGWDASRPPYPGLLAFQEEDAAIYFGRDDDIRRLIERLNARRAQGGAKLIALLGASGSGKSSLMRAGVIPRLKRAGRNWIALPPMRPQARPIDELAQMLAIATDRGKEWQALRTRLESGRPADLLHEIAGDLRVRHAANEAQILWPIDQAEELFGAADPDQVGRFLDILSAAMAPDMPYLGILAMRSDYLGSLQGAERLTARFEEFSLGPLPLARIPQIIEGPARVGGLAVDDAFVHQAAHDAETEDALPLLAFALRELYDRSSGDNHLSLDEYQALGDAALGLTPLENAVRKRADEVLHDARPDEATLTALREAFVPNMVRVNDQGEYVRQPARWDALPARAHPLLEKLANARLLILRQADDVRIVEVAHEALLRKWPRLRGWLDDAREFLTGKQQLEVDLRDWQNADASDKDAALLTGLKLTRAQGWLAARPHQLSTEERALIQASVDRQEAAERRKARQRRIITASSIAAAIVLAVFAVFAGYQWLETQNAFKTRATELARYAWVDLAEQQVERDRLTNIASNFGLDSNELVPEVLICANEYCTEYEPQWDGYQCGTGIPNGFRYLYCSIRQIINLEKVQSIAGMSIFEDGSPHTGEFNLYNSNQFGHYNPDFLTWLDSYIIPEGRSDPRFNQLTRIAYDAYGSSIARALYHTHEILFAQPDEFRVFEDNYQTVKEAVVRKYDGQHFGIGFMSQELRSFDEIKDEYSQMLESSDQIPDLYFENSFFPVSDYLTNVKQDDWYMANTAGGFWVRRSLDGTEAQFFELVKKVLQTFEPEVLGFRPSDPPSIQP